MGRVVGALRKQDSIDFSKGFNSYKANDVVPPDQLVFATDARISTLGRYKTRQGCDFYSVPAGETANAQQASTTGAADQTISSTSWRAAKFTTTAAGRLTKVELRVKNTAAGTGPIIVKAYSDSSGSPGTLLAQSSIPAASITSSYQYLSARFIEAPALANATAYWIVAHIQEDGTNTYLWSSTTTATTSKSSSNSGVSWSTTTFDLNFKTYLSTDSPSLGHYRAYKSDGTKTSLLAHGTSLYTVNEATGALTAIKTGLSVATDYDFETINDTVYYCNGVDAPRKWNFTTEAAVTSLAGMPASHVIQHKSMLFWVSTDRTKIFFSNPADPETYTSTDFLYVPSPKSPNWIINWCVLNDNLIIFTPVDKWALYGSDLASMVLRKTPGTKGCVSRRSLAVTRNHAYFASDDGLYRFNGSTDELLTEDWTSDYAATVNKDEMAGVVWNNRYYLFYTPAGDAFNNECLVYNINYNSLESRDLGTYVKMGYVWAGAADTGQFVHVSNLVGAVYYAEQASNSYNNLGKALTFELRPRYEHYGDPAAAKKIRRWKPRFSDVAGAYSVQLYYDKNFADSPTLLDSIALTGSGSLWNGGHTWNGTFTWGGDSIVAPRRSIPGSAEYTQLRYKREGVNQPVEFLGHSAYFRTKRAK